MVMSKNGAKQIKISKGTLGLVIAVCALAVLMAFLLILRTNQSVCEWICRNLVSGYQAVAGRFFSVTRANIFEISAAIGAAIAIAMIITSIVLFCKKKRVASRRVMLSLIVICFCIANLYIFAAGFAYNREAAPLVKYQGDVSKEHALESYISLIDDIKTCYDEIGNYNEDGSVICPYSERELDDKVRKAVDDILKDDYYYSYTPKAKAVISSRLMTYNSIAGITFLPTCEPCYNKEMPIVERVHTLAHEYAHTKGVMREYEANLVATYVLLNSGDAYLKYCAYVDAYSDIDDLIRYDETYFDNVKLYDTPEGFDRDCGIILFWWWHQPSFGDFGSIVNDLYLKLQGQSEGTGSYEETPGTDEIIIGGEDGEEDRYLEIITEYTNMHRMLIAFGDSLKS